MIVLDTNVVSEVMKPAPSSAVLRWFAVQPALSLFTTSITQAEVLYGVELLPKGRRRAALDAAVRAMFEDDFKGRVLPFDSEAALLFPVIAATRRAAGRPISQLDAQIAAIARSRGAAIATRNSGDFEDCGVEVVNPWEAE